jgi:hypothetical protein
MKAFDRQFVVECAGITGFAPVAFSVQFTMVGKQSVGDGFSRRDCRSDALKDGAGGDELPEAIPVVFHEPQLAMKGGTALNLFI